MPPPPLAGEEPNWSGQSLRIYSLRMTMNISSFSGSTSCRFKALAPDYAFDLVIGSHALVDPVVRVDVQVADTKHAAPAGNSDLGLPRPGCLLDELRALVPCLGT